MILFKMSLNQVRQHPGRSLLTLLSVVIGVAAVVSVLSATRTTRSAYHDMFQAVNGNADLEIRAHGGVRFDENVIDLVRQSDAVETAVPLIHRNTILYAESGRAKLTAVGIDPELDASVREYELVDGEMLTNGTGVWLDHDFASRMQIKLGDQIKLLTRSGLKKSNVIGLVRPLQGSGVIHGGMVYMSIRRAQYRFRIGKTVNAISIVLKESADPTVVQTALNSCLPENLSADFPRTNTGVAKEAMFSNEQGLRLATAFMWLLAVFVITNTFAMSVGQRRKQFAVMRAIGATKRQVTRLLLLEALAVGVIGTGLGILAGMYGADLLAHAMGQSLMIDLPRAELTTRDFGYATLFGIGIAFAGAYFPIRSITSVPPVEAMMTVYSKNESKGNAYKSWLGALVFVVSNVVLYASVRGWLPMRWTVVGSVMGLVAMVLLIPWLISPLSQLVASVCFRRTPVESHLARRQLQRHRGRTTLTVGVLFVAITTGITLSITISNNLEDVNRWYRRSVVGDLFVRGMMPDMSTGEAADLPEGFVEEVRSLAGVANVESLKFVSARALDDISVLVIVREYQPDGEQYFDVQSGDQNEIVQEVKAGDVVIGSVLSQRQNLHVDDRIRIETAAGPKDLRIAAIADDYLGGGLTVYMDRTYGEQWLNVTGEDMLIIRCDTNQLQNVESQLNPICREHGLLIQSQGELIATIQSMLAEIVGSLRVLLVLGFCIASFGVANTLSMNVLEQTRELSMLRIVAMTRGQVRKMIFVQATMLGFIGLIPGAIVGVIVAYMINLSALPVLGHSVDFYWYPQVVFGSLIGGTVLILISAWIPAERAARISPTEALRYE